MKLLLIFPVFCFATLSRVHCEKDCYKEIFEQCARELNIADLQELVSTIKWNEFLANTNDDVLCMFTCILKKQHNYNTTTLHEGLLKAVDIAYENHFKTTKFTRDDVESKISNCLTQERDECKFVKCVEPTNLPFIDVLTYMAQV
ncbi:uncharacterized protein LOC131665668 isoform X2 [Phymastichus coffea]|uniref:uncharacterized protein LOC131665668 isoform X2 n=1 Tax=Phymastichus coffea TaxID=108790 RepID=UPI00273AE9AB|nr:uncharacterized protein LOC131665668 isoform X2 [Phymastichus coffea]